MATSVVILALLFFAIFLPLYFFGLLLYPFTIIRVNLAIRKFSVPFRPVQFPAIPESRADVCDRIRLWADAHRFAFIGMIADTEPLQVLYWIHPETGTTLSLGLTKPYPYVGFGNRLSGDQSLVTSNTAGNHWAPWREIGMFTQTFSDNPAILPDLELLARRHQEALKFLASQGIQVEWNPDSERFRRFFLDHDPLPLLNFVCERVFRDKTKLMTFIRSQPLWRVRIGWWMIHRPARRHNRTVENLWEEGIIAKR